MNAQTPQKSNSDTSNLWTEVQIALQRSAKQRLGIAWHESESNLAWAQPEQLASKIQQLHEQLLIGQNLTDFEAPVEAMAKLAERLGAHGPHSESSLEEVLTGLSLVYQLDRFAQDQSLVGIVDSMLSRFDFEDDSETPSVSTIIPETGSQLLIQQLCEIEFPLAVLSQCCSDLVRSRYYKFAHSILERFESLLDATVDGDGWIESKFTQQFWQLAVSWARSFALVERLGMSVREEARQQLEWICRQFLRSMGPDGQQMLGPLQQRAASLKLQELMVSLSLDRVDKKLARLRDPNRESKKKDDINQTLFDESGFSEWASNGVFQCGWASYSPRIAISANQTELSLEIAAQVSLIRGRSETRIRFNDQQLDFFNQEHEILCWHCDDGVEYVEFQFQLDQGATLDRQVMLFRDERFAILADAVCFPESGQIEYELRLPLAEGMSVLHESETREVYLKDTQIRALVLPLGMGEWQSDGMPGALEQEQNCLVSRRSCTGRAIYSPLFIDLSPQRSKRPRTWRQLAVAEDRTNLKDDEAVAYRIQIGKEQWLVYRSLNGTGNRTFMGENQICEFFVARTDGRNEADELLQIE